MQGSVQSHPTRRRFIGMLMMSVSALALVRVARPLERDDLVEVAGWILKRSDLA